MNGITQPERPTVVLKTLAAVGMLCLLLAISILNIVPPAEGYEISIYQVYPWYLWGSLIGSIFLGQTVIVGSVRYNDGRDRTWILGLVLVLLSGIVLLLMPFIRGYLMYGGVDELTHIGFIHDISQVGIAGNIYPAMHLIIYVASSATGLEPETIMKLLPLVVSFVFAGGLFYMTRNFYSRTHALYALPFVLILFIGYKTSTPYSLSVRYLPFVIYLFIKERRMAATPLAFFLVLAIFGVVFLHPLTTFLLIVTFGIYVAIKKISWSKSKFTHPTMALQLTVVVFSAWFFNFVGIIRRFERVVNRITGRTAGNSALGTVTSTVSTYSPDLTDIVMIAILDYGQLLILWSLAGLFLVLAAYLWLRDKIEVNIFIILFSCVFVLFTVASALAFVISFGFGWERFVVYEVSFVTVLSASLFYFLYQQLSSRTLQRGLTVSLVVVLSMITVLAVLTSFASLAATENNPQSTEMNIDGSEWVLENRDERTLVDNFGLSLSRYEDYHRGTLNGTIRGDGTTPPDHFGYDGNETVGKTYDENRYLIITKLGKETYPKTFPDYRQYWRFTPADFDQLERDRAVSRLYDNGEFELYYITAEE